MIYSPYANQTESKRYGSLLSSRLYYKDDLVFNPIKIKTVRPGEIRTLIGEMKGKDRKHPSGGTALVIE
jgi:hypothetical protein